MADRKLSSEFLQHEYIDLGKTRYQISEETGVTPEQIGSLLQRYGIKRYTVTRHGLCKHPLNVVWCGMKERCYNPNASNYLWYGAEGVTVCEEWLSFKGFYDWAIENGWEKGLTIDRIDIKKGYSPDNCRLVPMKQQFRNRRSNVYITVDDVTMLQCEWEEKLGLRRKIIAKWKNRHGMEYVVSRLREEMQNENQRVCN